MEDAIEHHGQSEAQQSASVLRAPLAALPRRFLPPSDFKLLLQLLPSDVALEILDGLPAVPVFAGSTRFNFSDILGRFLGDNGRQFVLVRRNIEFYVPFPGDARDAFELSFKRNIALILRSARHMHYREGTTPNFQFRKLVFEKLCAMREVQNLVSISLEVSAEHDSLASLMQGTLPSILARVTRFTAIDSHMKQGDGEYFRMMPNLRHIVLPLDTYLVLWALPFEVLEKIKSITSRSLSDQIAKRSFASIKEHAKSLASLDITIYPRRYIEDMNTSRNMVALMPSCITHVQLMYRAIPEIQKLPRLSNLIIEFDDIEQLMGMQEALMALNSRGQLLCLSLREKVVSSLPEEKVMDQVLLESLGIGHPNCALRYLEIDIKTMQVNMDSFLQIARSSRLETLRISLPRGSTEISHQIARYLENQGLIFSVLFESSDS